MAKSISKLSKSLKQLGDIQVNNWELPEILRKDISEFEIRDRLQRIAKLQVTEWELRDLIPALRRLAQKEVDVVGILKQAAAYKVIDWDQESASMRLPDGREIMSKEALAAVTRQLQSFLEFTIFKLINEPRYATIVAEEIAPQVIRFRVLLQPRDISILVGSNGQTSTPIRRLLKAAARRRGVHALLKIQSYDEVDDEEKRSNVSATPKGSLGDG